MELAVRQYLDRAGRNPFGRWFDGLDRVAAAKVRTALARLQTGHTSSVKGVGAGVFEARIAFGPGYRVYFGKHGAPILILLGGGTKARQARDIADAHARWQDYQDRTPRSHGGAQP